MKQTQKDGECGKAKTGITWSRESGGGRTQPIGKYKRTEKVLRNNFHEVSRKGWILRRPPKEEFVKRQV